MTINDDNLDIVILCALRYAMTRRSYVVGTMQDFIKKHWSKFDKYTKNNIILDIGAHLAENTDDPADISQMWNQLYNELS